GGAPGGPDLVLVVGYPPFQHVIHAPESLKQADPSQVAAYNQYVKDYPALLEAFRKRLAEAEKPYGGKFEYIRDEGGVAGNYRLRAMSEIMRHYRGEVIHALLQSGDPETGKLVMTEIGRQATNRSPFAFDLLSYAYLASFDGALNLYDQPALDQMSALLEQG